MELHNLFNKEELLTTSLCDLQTFFETERHESDKVEFKSYKDFATENSTKSVRDKERLTTIIKSICGFLNSEGGILIWGAPEGIKSQEYKEKVYKGALTPVTYLIEKDEIINRISDGISPTPIGIFFHRIEISAEAFYYIFYVPKSEFSPHQYKGTYYMRLDGSTRPAPHHYVEALMKRISYPRLQCYLTFGRMHEFKKFAGMIVQISIFNLSKVQNDKNIHCQLLCVGGDIIPFSTTMVNHIRNQCEISLSRDVIHFAIPTSESYMFLTEQTTGRVFEVTFLLSVWGDLSPAIGSTYILKIYPDKNLHTAYEIIKKDENVYFMDNPKFEMQSEKEHIVNSTEAVLKIQEENIYKKELFKNLHGD